MKYLITLILCLLINYSYSQKSLKCGRYEFFYQKENSIWQKIKYNGSELKSISNGNNLFLIFECNSINISKDNSFLMIRQILSDKVPKDSIEYLSTYEAPYIVINSNNDSFAPDFVTIQNKKLVFFSNSQGRGEFVDNHNLLYEDNKYYFIDDFIEKLPSYVKNKSVILNIDSVKELMSNNPINNKNVKLYNDIAFFLSYNESIYLLNKILEKYPNRVVAYLNLADSYWAINKKDLAKENYKKYVALMKSQNKDLKKIPKQVWERIK
jgi:hypothetical protein